MSETRRNFAIYTITKHGIELAKRLNQELPGSDLYLSERFDPIADSKPLSLPIGPQLAEQFFDYDCHVFVISVGAVVRMIAPLLRNKKVDPAVICIDDRGQFVISLLSGHVGRANELTHLIARTLGATPVITTASDVQGTFPVDILGRELGWQLEDMEHNVTRACAAVVNELKVLFVQETGEAEFWPLAKVLPPGIEYSCSIPEDISPYDMLLIASDRSVIPDQIYQKAVIYRPRSLVLGIGCDRDTPQEMIERGIDQILKEYQLSSKSVAAIATIDAKADEQGLVAYCEEHKLPLLCYSPAELDAAKGIESPSETVRKFMGTRTVAEGAALLAAGCEQLLVKKQKYFENQSGKNMTIAICRKPFPKRYEVEHVGNSDQSPS